MGVIAHPLGLHLKLVSRRWHELVKEIALRRISVKDQAITKLGEAMAGLSSEALSRHVRVLSLEAETAVAGQQIGTASTNCLKYTILRLQALRMRGIPARSVHFVRAAAFLSCRHLDLDAGEGAYGALWHMRAAIAEMPSLRTLKLCRFATVPRTESDPVFIFARTIKDLRLWDCALNGEDMAFIGRSCGELEKLDVRTSNVRESETIDHLAASGLIKYSLVELRIGMRNAPPKEVDAILFQLADGDSQLRRLALEGSLSTSEPLSTLLPASLRKLAVICTSLIDCDALAQCVKTTRLLNLRSIKLAGTAITPAWSHRARFELQTACWARNVQLSTQTASRCTTW